MNFSGTSYHWFSRGAAYCYMYQAVKLALDIGECVRHSSLALCGLSILLNNECLMPENSLRRASKIPLIICNDAS